MIYLDHNATTPLDPRVLEAMLPYLRDKWGNASSRDHAYGWDAQEAVEDARAHVAALINAAEHEIIFSSGTTESLHIALQGIFPWAGMAVPASASEGGGLLLSEVEHESLRGAARSLRKRGVRVDLVGVDRQGRLDMESLDGILRERRPALLALMAANNETGVLFPIRECAALAQAHGARLLVDAALDPVGIPLDASRDGFDLAALSAHKFYGPKGIGALYLRGGPVAIPLSPALDGGGQEHGLRPGTLNVPAIVGFGEACRIALKERDEETSRLQSLRNHLEAILTSRFPEICVNGDRDRRVPNTSNLVFPGTDARVLIRDMHDVAVSTRSACSSGSTEPSHVLIAMGLPEADAFASIRFSLGRFTTLAEVESAASKAGDAYLKCRGKWNAAEIGNASGSASPHTTDSPA